MNSPIQLKVKNQHQNYPDDTFESISAPNSKIRPYGNLQVGKTATELSKFSSFAKIDSISAPETVTYASKLVDERQSNVNKQKLGGKRQGNFLK